MHRFRKRSDASTKPATRPSQNQAEWQPLPELPPASNFRTSLILPDLTRRFTLLRTSSGQPLSIEQLRARFAEQRARGAENSISEEEEDMLLETLGRIREGREDSEEGVDGAGEDVADGEDSLAFREVVGSDHGSYGRSSVRSSNTATSYVPSPSVGSSPSSRSAKRYSNNLFGSGRDYNYIRNQTTRTGSERSVPSITPTESSSNVNGTSTYYDRPGTPEGEGSTFSSSGHVQSSPIADADDKTPMARSMPLSPSGPSGQTEFAVEYRLSKTLNPAALKRASLALDEALKEIEEDIEEEAEDQIVMPRSAPATKTQYMDGGRFSSNSNESDSSFQRLSKFKAGTALSPEKYSPDAEEQRASPVPSFRSRMSPSPRLPGYIPGMPRPMTPRDQSFDGAERARSHSTTPRPTSPILPNINGSSSPLIPAGMAAGLMRRETNVSTAHSPRTHNGSFSVDAQRSYDSSTDESVNSSSSVYTRRRPASPLATPSYQPMAVPPRPTTPSNITWNTSSNSISSGAPKSHSRNASESSIDATVSPERSVSVAGRSLRSPTPHDSPLIDDPSFRGGSWDGERSSSRNRTPAAVPNIDLGSPVVVSNRSMHSPTPTQSRSPAPAPLSLTSGGDVFSGSTSKRSSRQQGGQSPFDFGRTYPLVFSPIAKSSRSSIASEGSSYHSDDGMNRLDCDFDFFGETTAKPSWHDVSGSDIIAAGRHDDSQDDSEPEDIINRYAGLTKADFVAIQEKLVTAAVNKAATPDPRERAPSLRRRRPSTSQSNYSLNGKESRVASPPPQVKTNSREMLSTPQKIERPPAASVSPDSIGSLQSSPNSTTNAHRPAQSVTSPTQQQVDLSPTSRRNRDLAEAIFGDQNQDYSPPEESLSPPEKMSANVAHYFTPSTPPLLVRSPSQLRSPVEEPASATSSSQHYPTQMSRNPSILRSPPNLADTDLALEVQRKIEAATASLKRGPSVKYHDNGSSISVARKRIAPHQISSPHLVSSSTSLDTIPLRSASVASTNASNTAPKPGKLGSRLRRWGTLRGKPILPNGDEVTPFLLDAQTSPTSPSRAAPSPSFAETAQYVTSNVSIPQAPASAGLAEPVRPQAPLPSPPATAGPGIKNFMSRFRKTSKTSDSMLDNGPTSHDYGGRTSTEQGRSRQPLPEFTFPQSATSANVAPHTPSNLFVTPPQDDSSAANHPVSHNQSQSSTNHSLALKQLFDAASTIGLDQTALNDLLQRSGSTSSNATMLTRNNSLFTNSTLPSPNEALSRSRPPYDGKSQANFVASDRGDDTIKMPISGAARKRGKADDNDSGANAVVRRTLIFPSEAKTSTIDLNILMRKNSSARRRRSASAASVTSSSRSVHDRAPTPPPPRSPTGRRFSHDASPPVPQLPASLSAQAESLLMPVARPRPTPAGSIEKSNSAYESLYDMYGGDRAGSGGFSDSEVPPDAASPEPARAVEVIELANGETIWSIVNGLRDDDAESLYASRSSFASEYSAPEHARTGSKGSTSSFLSRKKSPTGKNRPETKIFYSSSNQIGRLIENLSEGQEAGSFNFVPSKRPGHSAKSSLQSDGDMHWTVEERLEHMLGSMSTS